jgi:cyclophilin family peptidyl-prolyl cis-trans isomerase
MPSSAYEFFDVEIPFANFTDLWSPATGEPTSTCKQDASACATAKVLASITRFELWAEGAKGAVDIGTGGPGYTLAAEIRRKHLAGSLAMGRIPDKLNPQRRSNGSQFYFALQALPELDGTDTVFGQVLQGMEVLQELGQVATDTNDSPVTRIQVVRSKVVPRERLETELRSFNKKRFSWWPF